jgi:hypothetical protein
MRGGAINHGRINQRKGRWQTQAKHRRREMVHMTYRRMLPCLYFGSMWGRSGAVSEGWPAAVPFPADATD